MHESVGIIVYNDDLVFEFFGILNLDAGTQTFWGVCVVLCIGVNSRFFRIQFFHYSLCSLKFFCFVVDNISNFAYLAVGRHGINWDVTLYWLWLMEWTEVQQLRSFVRQVISDFSRIFNIL